MRQSLLVLLLVGIVGIGTIVPNLSARDEVQAVPVVDPPSLPLALSDEFEFLKTKTLLVDSADHPKTSELMIPGEYDRIFYGAISDLDREQRFGNYYTFFWKTDRPANVTLRLEYRQAAYGDFIQAVEIPYSNVDGKQMSRFKIIGDDFKEGGAVTSWRCMLIENNTIVALTTSRLWK